MSRPGPLRLCRPTLPAFAAVGIYWGAYAAQVPVLKAGIGAPDGLFGVALLIATLGAVGAMWLAPRVEAALSARTMPVLALGMAACFLLPGLAPSLPLFALSMFLAAAATGLLDVTMNARVSGLEAASGRGLMNLNHATFSFAYALSAMAAGAAREAGVAPPAVFAALGAVTLLLMPLMRMAPERHMAEDETHPHGPGFAHVVIWTGLITLVAFLTEHSTESWSALHIERTLGGGAAQGAFGPAILGLMMGAGRLAGHFVTPRGHERRVIAAAALVAATGAATAAAAPSPGVAYLGFATLGLGVSVIAPLALALAGQMVRARDRARAISRTAVIGYFGFFIGPPLMGLVSEAFGLRLSYATIAVLACTMPLMLWPLRRSAAASGPRSLRG